jgi:adenylate cyclase class 2
MMAKRATEPKTPTSAKTSAKTPSKKKSESATEPSDERPARPPIDVEVEVKLPCDDVSCLTDAGLVLESVKERYFEDNWVYALPDGKLRKGQYLRIRYVGNGNGSGRRREGVLTYKGKSKRESDASKRKNKGKKVREEIETTIGKPTKLVKIFKRLGLRRSFRYQKMRSVYRIHLDENRSILAMFDETPIGNFLELEGDTDTIEVVARKLGYKKRDYISDSYVEMQLAHCAERGEELSDMLFDRDHPAPPRKKTARARKREPRSAKRSQKK